MKSSLDDDWQVGMVTELMPLKVRSNGGKCSLHWKYVRKFGAAPSTPSARSLESSRSAVCEPAESKAARRSPRPEFRDTDAQEHRLQAGPLLRSGGSFEDRHGSVRRSPRLEPRLSEGEARSVSASRRSPRLEPRTLRTGSAMSTEVSISLGA